jgi:SAM-dependent methyltransferase
MKRRAARGRAAAELDGSPPARAITRRATHSLNLRSTRLLRWLLKTLWQTWLGPDAPSPQRDELRRSGELRAGRAEFADGARFFRHFRGALHPPDFLGKEILDVGCGYGGRSVFYAEKCGASSVHGIEVTLPMVERCRELAAELSSTKTTFAVGRAEQLPFPDESFDAVLSFDVLEHCEDPRQALKEMSRVLRPAGKAWNVFPTYKGARSSHLGYVTQLPVHRVFHPDTLMEVVNEFVARESERLKVRVQPGASWSSIGHYTLPRLNGLTLEEARRIFNSTPGLRCDRIVVTPLIDDQLSMGQMQAAIRSSRTLGFIAYAVAHALAVWQRVFPLPELLVQNIAVCATKS